MTVKEFNSLADGTAVWLCPPYFVFAMPATVRIRNGRRGLWINFYGDAQCRFEPQDGREKRLADWISFSKCPQNTYENDKTVINEVIP